MPEKSNLWGDVEDLRRKFRRWKRFRTRSYPFQNSPKPLRSGAGFPPDREPGYTTSENAPEATAIRCPGDNFYPGSPDPLYIPLCKRDFWAKASAGPWGYRARYGPCPECGVGIRRVRGYMAAIWQKSGWAARQCFVRFHRHNRRGNDLYRTRKIP